MIALQELWNYLPTYLSIYIWICISVCVNIYIYYLLYIAIILGDKLKSSSIIKLLNGWSRTV